MGDISQTSDYQNELYELSQDFESFFKVDTAKQIAETECLIDGILAKLEELCTVVEMIRSESKDVLFTILPVLHHRCQDLTMIFKQIDRLETFMSMVKECVEDNEEKVKIAEKELGSKNIKKLLNNVPVPKFLLKRKDIQLYTKKEVTPLDYKHPKTFRTEDYFEPYKTLQKNTTEDT
ncbi:biogenesis of lysosome-related organelles complex 1 subunit 4 [Hydra vulgaris]|uniref:Protein cappuccino homolog n=1 Tax=Hydra vulgaris TaxID=6087 RepID=T2M549_HYDVU|nr:biogenesis of lysosome-related organelles complex 1 subunit 4 [Hydra vulgaris]